LASAARAQVAVIERDQPLALAHAVADIGMHLRDGRVEPRTQGDRNARLHAARPDHLRSDGTFGNDGHWQVERAAEAPGSGSPGGQQQQGREPEGKETLAVGAGGGR
jgi:hypothetical protein